MSESQIELFPDMGNDKMNQINQLSMEMDSIVSGLAELESQADMLNKRLKEILEKQLPMIFADLHIDKLTLKSGRTITIKDQYFASAPQARINQIYDWLKERNMEAIVDDHCVLPGDMSGFLVSHGIMNFERSRKIHPQRLLAFVREQLTSEAEQNNPTFPRELFGVSQVQRATVKDKS
jgi:hypothetical protein